jgi:hypothetical protein
MLMCDCRNVQFVEIICPIFLLGKHVYDNNNYMKIPKNYCGTL